MLFIMLLVCHKIIYYNMYFYMPLQKRSNLQIMWQWKEFLNSELNISKSNSWRYAGVFVDEEYDEEPIKYLLANSTPGVPSSTLLLLGIKAGHCVMLAMYYVTPSTVSSNLLSHNMKVMIPQPVVEHGDASQNVFYFTTN